jgi:hypothetical protein
MKCNSILALTTAGLFLSLRVMAQGPVITIDENGNGIGTLGPGFLANDPGPGGLPNVLTYNLPFNTTKGDVLLTDFFNGTVSVQDVLRFNGNGTVVFYSDNIGGSDALADTPSAPRSIYPVSVTLSEVGPEGNNGAFYTPVAGGPGFFANAVGASGTYHFISDATSVSVPEPGGRALLAVFGTSGAVLLFRRRRVPPVGRGLSPYDN